MVPFRQTLVLRGKMGSKSDLFEDAKVQEKLMRHHIRVHVTRTGSRDIATHDLSQYDFVFLSGEPAAGLVRRSRANEWTGSAVTYRRYAQELQAREASSGPVLTGDPALPRS